MLILLHGPDSYRISQKLNKYKERFLRDIDPSGINIETLDGREVTVESFRRAVLSGGLFVKKRLVIIKNLFSSHKTADAIDEQNDEPPVELASGKSKELFAEIENYVNNNKDSADTILIFVQTEAHKQQQSKLFKLLAKQKFSENFPSLAGVELNNWIKKETESRGGKIDSQSIQFLVQNIGSDLWQMSNEIDKLVAFKNHNEICLKDVQQFVKPKLDENIFNLTDAFGRQDKALALKLLSDQIQSGAAWQYLLTMLARQIKINLQIKSGLEAGLPQYQLAKSLDIHPYVIQKTIPQARLFSIDGLKKIYSRLLEIDLQLKSIRVNPELLFDLLIIN